eukprot:scaffold6232_cov59-Cylindrotheca_fusiformis.AAC.1
MTVIASVDHDGPAASQPASNTENEFNGDAVSAVMNFFSFEIGDVPRASVAAAHYFNGDCVR